MIIKSLSSTSEFLEYGAARINFTGTRESNISKSQYEYEFDAYDRNSFHFGAFQGGALHACTRMVNDIKGIQKFDLDNKSVEILEDLSEKESPKNGLALQDYVDESEFDEVDSFFQSLREQQKSFNEIGRLVRSIKEGDKFLMNYMICYAAAFCRFYEIDYCFFEASQSHCKYYERFFGCKHVLQEVEFNPMEGGETFYLMQATMSDLPQRMNEIVNRILDKFKVAGKPCAVKLEEIK